MFLEVVRSEGLAQLSYILGDGGKAAVIDPRRDCKIYAEIAGRHGARQGAADPAGSGVMGRTMQRKEPE